MKQDIDGVMTETEARERGYLPTDEVPALIGVQRNLRNLGRVMRRDGLRPVRVGHAYWWSVDAVEEWAAQRRWVRAKGTTAPTCSAPGCDRGAAARGLCLRHYKFARGKHAGEPASRVGQPVGAGVYGRVDETADGRLVCHECGGAYLNLAGHVALAHGMSADEYRDAYELPRAVKLAAASVRERISCSSSRPENLERLARVRDPVAASAARTDDTFSAVSRAHRARYAGG